MKKCRFPRLPGVADDLAGIATFIAGHAGARIALRAVDEIETVIQKPGEASHNGSLRDEIPLGIRAIPAAGKGVACFVADDEHQVVRIMAIGHAGSGWPRVARSIT
ncbi:MAG: type II toxin-antitoxin system RelE/ParE family toxin [Boseongicola sp.]|nr:type II toxin-antitoxin system RelE/ParE family toxin [Boseongicola sp.]